MKKIEEKTKKKLQEPHENQEENNDEEQIKTINEAECLNEVGKKENNHIRLNKRRIQKLVEGPVEKKQKKSDFKHPTQFISAEPQINRV